MTHRELFHHDEKARLDALHALQILDTPIEERFERLTRLGRKAFDMPICAISCIDKHRQWFKSIQGNDAVETDRCISFCQHTILEEEALIVNDARSDRRFASSPLVRDDPGVVFYAGVPIRQQDGLPMAAFCVIDTKPRTFDLEELDILKDIAKLVEQEMSTQPSNPIERQLTHLVGESWRASLIDPLTRLWNREGICAIIDAMLDPSSPSTSSMCVAMVHLSELDEINKTLGQAVGDDFLRSFSRDLLREIGEDDSLGRIHNNVFSILLNSVTNPYQARAALYELRSFVDSFPVHGIVSREMLGAVVGGVLVPEKWAGTSALLLDQLDEMTPLAKHADRSELTIVSAKPIPKKNDHDQAPQSV